MTEKEFWRCYPRKFFALLEAHKKYMGIESKEDEKPKRGFIDQILP